MLDQKFLIGVPSTEKSMKSSLEREDSVESRQIRTNQMCIVAKVCVSPFCFGSLLQWLYSLTAVIVQHRWKPDF